MVNKTFKNTFMTPNHKNIPSAQLCTKHIDMYTATILLYSNTIRLARNHTLKIELPHIKAVLISIQKSKVILLRRDEAVYSL